MLQRGRFLCAFLLIIVLSSFAFAAEFTVSISNSEKWQDVYSTMLIAGLQDADSEFLVSTAHGPILANGISSAHTAFIVSSEDAPFVFNYADTLRARGFRSVEEIFVDNANLDLLEEELPDIQNFIIVSNDAGHNAVAVVQYAKKTNSWVFLADRANIADISQLLSERDVNDIIIYGYVDREVREALDQYDPEIISTGDKFKDNIEIFKKYDEIAAVDQIVLTNGEFLEKEIMLGDSAVLFTGRQNVPDQIRDYLLGSDVKIGVLIGNELINAATNIKRTAGIDVIAKFARGARGDTGGAVAVVEGLDLFYLPSARISLEIFSIKYNRATSMLEVTYESDSNVPVYFKGTIEIESNGDTTRVGDIDPIFISPGDYKTIAYEDLENINENDIVADVYTLYGEFEAGLDQILEGRYEVDVVNVIDSCQMEPTALVYNKQKEMFYVKVKNIGSEDCYVDIEMRDVLINEVETTIGSDEPILVKSGRSKKIYVEQRMDEEDLRDNDRIRVHGYYGQRRESLTSEFISNMEISVRTFSTITWIIIILIILIILLIILAWWYRRREDSF